MKSKAREVVDNFSMHLQGLMNELEVLEDSIDEKKAPLKFLSIVPAKYRCLAWSIESLVDLSTMSRNCLDDSRLSKSAER